ncbi:MAG: hypothetical protein JST07_10920 [Bacteroidetes bacterium]|nr:hypothetical protein [Bacteroidota bacterium]
MEQKINSVSSAGLNDDSSTNVDNSVAVRQHNTNAMLAEVLPKKAKCYNCKFGGTQFKINKKTHLHCNNEELYPVSEIEKGDFSPWDTLREWYSKCNKHEFRQ